MTCRPWPGVALLAAVVAVVVLGLTAPTHCQVPPPVITREALRAERLESAEALERCAAAVRDLQHEIEVQPEPPSRVVWLLAGAAAAAALFLVPDVAR